MDADPRHAVVGFSGGRWTPELPLTNLREPLLVRAALSVDTAPSSTRFWVDLGKPRAVRVAAIPFLTVVRDDVECPPPDTTVVRWRAYDTPDLSDDPVAGSDTGWRTLYTPYPEGTLRAEDEAFLDGLPAAEDRNFIPMPAITVYPDADCIARYWLCEIDLACSGYDHLAVPRLFLAPGWQPSHNFEIGATEAFEDPSTVETTPDGVEYWDVKPLRRLVRVSWGDLGASEARTWVGGMQRRLGLSGQLYYIQHPDRPELWGWTSMLCRMRSLSPREAAAGGLVKSAIELKEVVA